MKYSATFHNSQSDLCLILIQNIHFMIVLDRDKDSQSLSHTCFESKKFSFSYKNKIYFLPCSLCLGLVHKRLVSSLPARDRYDKYLE